MLETYPTTFAHGLRATASREENRIANMNCSAQISSTFSHMPTTPQCTGQRIPLVTTNAFLMTGFLKMSEFGILCSVH